MREWPGRSPCQRGRCRHRGNRLVCIHQARLTTVAPTSGASCFGADRPTATCGSGSRCECSQRPAGLDLTYQLHCGEDEAKKLPQQRSHLPGVVDRAACTATALRTSDRPTLSWRCSTILSRMSSPAAGLGCSCRAERRPSTRAPEIHWHHGTGCRPPRIGDGYSMRPRNALRVGEVVRIVLDDALWRSWFEHAVWEPMFLAIGDGFCLGIKSQPAAGRRPT